MDSNITAEQWQGAYDYLQEMIQVYAEIPTGTWALNQVLFPLRTRYLTGERTADLYKKMLEVH